MSNETPTDRDALRALVERARLWCDLANLSPEREVFSTAWQHTGIIRDLATASPDRITALLDDLDAAERKVAAVEALVRKWSLLAGQAMDNDTREWLNAVVDTLRPILDTPAATPTERCSQCGPGYRVGDDGCGHTQTEPDADEREAAYRQADDQCRGPRWPKSARPAEQEVELALADAVIAEMVPPSELQQRHERGNHDACPPYWCDHVEPTGADS